jgi:acetyltransferase-like isoleucine patch superfamily enzyme
MSLGWNDAIKKEFAYCGEQVFVGHNVLFAYPEKVFIEDRVRIDPFTFITTGLKVGSNSFISAFSMLGGGAQHTITLEGWNVVGYGAKLFCASEDYSGEHGPVNEYWGHNEIRRGDITLKKYSVVASDVMVFPGVTVPEGCCVGAKSFIHTKAVLEPWTVMIGNPPIIHRHRNKAMIIAADNDPTFLKQR